MIKTHHQQKQFLKKVKTHLYTVKTSIIKLLNASSGVNNKHVLKGFCKVTETNLNLRPKNNFKELCR